MTTLKIEMNERDVREALAEFANRHHWINNQNVNADDVVITSKKVYYDRQSSGDKVVFDKAVISIHPKEAFMTDGILASLEA